MSFKYDLTQTPDFWFKRHTKLEVSYVQQAIAAFLVEDMPEGDATTLSTISETKESSAHIIAAQPLVFAGAQILPHIFSSACQIQLRIEDGQQLEKGGVLAKVKGPAQELLARERVMLNLIQRLCGIATLTRQFVDLEAPRGFKILDTRKTTPGLRLFEKYAVALGGGYNHRLDLSSVIMIKDNHLVAAGGIQEALDRVRINNADLEVELEVDTLEQLKEALDIGGIQALLLDNMSPQHIQEAVQIVRAHPKGGMGIFLEASGGMNYETLPDYLWTGVNGVSIGALTTQAQNVDIKLEFI